MTATVRTRMLTIYRRLPVIRELRNIATGLQTLASAKVTQLHDFQLHDHPRFRDPRRLLAASFQVSSQDGEDGMLREIFRRIGISNRVFAEIGVGDGTENNSAFLLSQGWTGFWIDGDPTFLRRLARADLVAAVRGIQAFVTRENIASLFAELGVPNDVDLLSIDIDQNTPHVWGALTTVRPRVAVIEYNPSIPPDVAWTTEYVSDRVWDGSHNYGGSLKALEILGRRLGYSLVGCSFCGANAFFVRDDLVADHFAAPFTSENHYEPARHSMLTKRGHRSEILDRP